MLLKRKQDEKVHKLLYLTENAQNYIHESVLNVEIHYNIFYGTVIWYVHRFVNMLKNNLKDENKSNSPAKQSMLKTLL